MDHYYSSTPNEPEAVPAAEEVTVESAVEQAKRAFALKKYEQAVDHYATALELMYVASMSPSVAVVALY